MQSTDTALTTLVGDHQWAVSEKKLFKDIVDKQTDAQTTDKGPSQKLKKKELQKTYHLSELQQIICLPFVYPVKTNTK